MRNFIVNWTLLPAALVVLAGCSKHESPASTAMNDDLARDLKLASQTQTLQINPDELGPAGEQQTTLKPESAHAGPKVVRNRHPTVKASPTAARVARITTEIPAVQVMASSPAPSETPTADAPPLARPSAIPAQTYPASEPGRRGDVGSGHEGAGTGILAGIFGAVIRGGIVGGDDHCDPRSAPPRSGRPIGGDINGQRGPSGMIGPQIGGMIGGIAGGRMPRGRP